MNHPIFCDCDRCLNGPRHVSLTKAPRRRIMRPARALLVALSISAFAAGCSGSPEPTCDARWDRCVAAGLTVECVSNGAEALCTCQGMLDGRLEALVCRP